MGFSTQQILQSDPDYLRRQMVQQEMQRLNPSGDAAGAIGALLGRGIGNIASGRGFMDTGDAGLRRVSQVQAIMSRVPFDPSNPAAYYEGVAAALQEAGFGDLAPEALKQAAQARTQAKELSLRERQIGAQEAEVDIKKQRATQGNVTNFVTKKGDAIIEREGRMYVQKVDDDGVVSLEPYKKATHGAFETKADYAAAQAAAGGVVRQPIVDPRTGFTTGYIILDRNGNEIRREMFGAQGAGAGAAPQGTGGGGAVPNIYQQELERRLKNK
jgi:hypothetical protein